MTAEMMALSKVTEKQMTSTSSDSEEETDETNVVIYITVPIATLVFVLITATVVILIRRHKNRKMENSESDPVYSANQNLTKKRRSIPGMQNQAYCTYSIEIKENNKPKNDKKNPNGLYRKTSHDSITELSIVDFYQNVNIQSISDMSNVYVNDNNKGTNSDSKVTSYSYVTNAQAGFEVKGDVYSDVTFEDQSHYKATLDRNGQGKGKIDADNSLETGWSIYDHANFRRAEQSVIPREQSFQLSEGENICPARHSYVNVRNQKDHAPKTNNNTRNTYDHIDCSDSSFEPTGAEEYSHLQGESDAKLNALPHKYENVTQEENRSLNTSTQRKHTGGYEDPVGTTPNYFMIDQ